MKTLVLTLALTLTMASASAHPTVVPHQHPHAASPLPDVFALLLAALLVGAGFAALRRMRKE